MSHRSILIVLALVLITLLASADIPKMISYQGQITDNGIPVADGSYNMRFRIYDVATGGTPLWDSGVQSIAFTDGIFNVLLGESPMTEVDLPFDDDYWLLVTFSGINQTPRQRLGSLGYAYMASGLVPGTVMTGSIAGPILDAQNTETSGWTVGIRGGTTSNEGWGFLVMRKPRQERPREFTGRATRMRVWAFTARLRLPVPFGIPLMGAISPAVPDTAVVSTVIIPLPAAAHTEVSSKVYQTTAWASMVELSEVRE